MTATSRVRPTQPGLRPDPTSQPIMDKDSNSSVLGTARIVGLGLPTIAIFSARRESLRGGCPKSPRFVSAFWCLMGIIPEAEVDRRRRDARRWIRTLWHVLGMRGILDVPCPGESPCSSACWSLGPWVAWFPDNPRSRRSRLPALEFRARDEPPAHSHSMLAGGLVEIS